MQNNLMAPGGVDFIPVSPSLPRARMLIAVMTMGAIIVATIVLGFFHWLWWCWIAAEVPVTIWLLWLVPRQARAISYAMTDDDFVIRRGIMFRSLVLVPYGRIQYVEVEEGPLARHYGFGTLKIHTASHATSATLPGVPMEEAVRIRDILSRQGSMDRSGL